MQHTYIIYREGRGRFEWKDSGNVYEGDFLADVRTGKGTFTWATGERYEGDFLDGKLHGNGVYSTPGQEGEEGRVVTGVFENGLIVKGEVKE